MSAIYVTPGGGTTLPIIHSGAHADQIGINDSPDNSPGLGVDLTFRNGGSANFYILTTPHNTNGLAIYTHVRETDTQYTGTISSRSYKGPINITCDVDNNDATWGPLNPVGVGLFSEVRVGINSQSYGTVLGVSSVVDIRNQPSGATNEYANWFAWMNAGTTAVPLATGGQFWFTDFGVQGPINRPNILNGISLVTNNFYNGSPLNGLAAGISLQACWDCGPANNYKRGSNSYPWDIGYHVGGASVAGTGDGYTNAIQVGGAVSAWSGSAALAGDQGQVGRGVLVKAKNAGTSVARLGAFVSEGTGEGGGLVFGLDTADANRASIYRDTNGHLTLNGNLTITGSIAAGSGISGSGSVTTVSVVSANGFAGSVANAASTPAITISTSVTGVLKGNGTAISAAAAGTDYISGAAGSVTLAQMANFAASSLMGNPTGSPAAPSAITLGPNLVLSGTTLRGRNPIVSVTAAGTAVANSTTLTSLFTGATLSGSLTIPANTLLVGSILRFELFGTFGVTASTPTLTVQLSLGGVIIGQGTSVGITSATGNSWCFDHVAGPGFAVQATGASGKIIGMDRMGLAAGAGITLNASGVFNGAPTQATINTTGSLAIDIKVQWSAANASNTIQLLGGAIYLDG